MTPAPKPIGSVIVQLERMLGASATATPRRQDPADLATELRLAYADVSFQARKRAWAVHHHVAMHEMLLKHADEIDAEGARLLEEVRR